MNDLKTIAPITTVERRRQQRRSELGRNFNSTVVFETAALARSRLQLCCGIRFIGEFQRLLPLSALILRIKFVLRLVFDFGILRAERYFVILDFFFVILDVSEVISET